MLAKKERCLPSYRHDGCGFDGSENPIKRYDGLDMKGGGGDGLANN